MGVYTFTELGYFTEKECVNIKKAMDGKTFMDFCVTWDNHAGNCTLSVLTDYEDSDENIKSFFLCAALTELAKRG